jgi:heptosyltransferase-3
MRILIHRLGSLGDTIVALPCFHIIRQTFPSAQITILTNPPVSEKAAPMQSILENTDLIDDAMHYPMGSRDYARLAYLHAEIRARRFDHYFALTHGRHVLSSIRDYIYFRTCGIPRIVGLPFGLQDRESGPIRGGSLYESEAWRLLRRIREIAPTVDSIDPNDPRWLDLMLTPDEQAEARRLLETSGIDGKFIVASIGTKWPGNDWGFENWNQIVAQVSRLYPGLALVLIGSSDEFDRCRALLNSWRGPKANLCGKSGPRISSGVMSNAKLFLGHDSGPMHLASASGIRCVAIFSARNPPGRWYPLGKGHIILYPFEAYQRERWNDVEYQRRAIGSISVASVLSAVQKILG